MGTQLNLKPRLHFDNSALLPHIAERARALRPQAEVALNALQTKSCLGAEFSGWFDWPAQGGYAALEAIEQAIASFDIYYDSVVVVGVGGSQMGCKAVYEALAPRATRLHGRSGVHRPIFFAGSSLCPAQLMETMALLEQRRPLVCAISKSGSTLEPALTLRVVMHALGERLGKAELRERVVVITDRDEGALRRLQQRHGFKSFEVPRTMGGRYSVLSAVGLVPLVLAGFDGRALLQGAHEQFQECINLQHRYPGVHYALARLAAWQEGVRIEVMSLMHPRLCALAEWWKQLFGESEGKGEQGIFPSSALLTADLHSLGQYLQEGPRHLLETFVSIDESHRPTQPLQQSVIVPPFAWGDDGFSNLEGMSFAAINAAARDGSREAHRKGGVSCLSLEFNGFDEAALGAFFAFMELSCALHVLMMGANPFDQPGVEAYKKELRARLRRDPEGLTT